MYAAVAGHNVNILTNSICAAVVGPVKIRGPPTQYNEGLQAAGEDGPTQIDDEDDSQYYCVAKMACDVFWTNCHTVIVGCCG